MSVTNIFWSLRLDTTIKSLIQKFWRFVFDSASRLNVTWPVSITSWTVTTVTTVSTWNMSFWDLGKNATWILASTQNFNMSVWKNFIRN